MTTITVKEYDTLRISVLIKDEDGQALNLNGFSVESTMRSSNNQLAHELIVELSDAENGMLVLTSPSKRFIPTLYFIDIAILDQSHDTRTTSFDLNVHVLRSITKPKEELS